MGITKGGRRKATAPAKSGIQKAEFDILKKKEVGVSDLTLLLKISDDAINDNLHKRFMNGSIYTYIGHVLISVNPFQDLGIYTKQTLDMYKGKNRLEVPPHVYAIAETMYYQLKLYNENQCVIISGESGAGKTEAAKQIMQYIANVSVSETSGILKIKDMVLATNPLLELFGCAKTLRNNNLSRHGKYLEIFFDAQSQPVAAHITNYLLEKQRVVQQITNERNFHIFYQFTKHCPPQYQQMFGIQGPQTYIYTSAAQCVDADGIDDGKDFGETLEAMRIIGLTQLEQDCIFRMLATILWIGNISFVEDESGNAAIRDEGVTNFVAYLLEVSPELVVKGIVERIIETLHGMRRGLTYHVPLNIVQATAVRDALAKGIYNNLFEWIVERVNVSLGGGAGGALIGILDIYGFEIFEHNSFEQICINYVNEKLQQTFIQLTLKAEQDEYVQEQILWTPIDYFNNKVVCDLIEATRPQPGLFAALNDLIKTAHADLDAADQVFAQRLSMVGAQNKHFEDRRGKFIIKHYAGDVTYDVAGMTDKNKDSMLRDLLELLATSKNDFVHQLFPAELLAAVTDSKKRAETASDKIKKSANLLVDTLAKCTPLYIRTIKPNQTKRPKEYDNQQVLHQVKYLGLKENVRIRRAGFAYRTTFDKFVQRFYLLLRATGYAGDYIWHGDDLAAVREILKDCHIPALEYQLGTTKVFIKAPETLFALEDMRDKYWHNMAARIQRAWRRYVKRKEDAAIVIQTAWRLKKHGNKYEQLRDEGTALLQGQKQRRRLLMLGSRAYMGDYLACNDSSGYGRFVVKQVGIQEHVVFSANGELLLLKFGRLSRRVPRMFVLTQKNLYVVSQVVVEKKLSLQKEFTIPVSGISYVALSTFADNWMAVSLKAATQQTPDIFLCCDFKTELMTHMKKINRGIAIKIGPTVQYQKKPGKYHTVKFVLGLLKNDTYKLGTVTGALGLPATARNPKRPRAKAANVDFSKYRNGFSSTALAIAAQRAMSGSRPAHQAPAQVPAQVSPRRKAAPPAPRLAQPATQATPQVTPQVTQPSQATQRPMHITQPVQLQPQPQPVQPQPVQPQAAKKAAPAPPPKKATPKKAAPPPPSSIAATPKHPMYKVVYDYDGLVPGSVPLVKDDVVYVVSINDKWGLVNDLKETQLGWAPLDFMRELKPGEAGQVSQPATQAVTQQAAQPVTQQATQPVTQQATQPATQPSQSNGLGNGLADALKAKKAEDVTLAGSLADALMKRKGATHAESDEEEEDDDDW